MQVRASAIRGMPIVEESTMQRVAVLDAPLIHPDTGAIEGFFVLGEIPEVPGIAFLAAIDIVAWGTSLHIRSTDCLAPPEDLVRMRTRFDDPRHVLRQPVRIQGTMTLVGVCADVQFDTRKMVLQWIFPRRFFLYRRPISVTEIVEVTPDAIIVRDPLRGLPDDTLNDAADDATRRLSVIATPEVS